MRKLFFPSFPSSVTTLASLATPVASGNSTGFRRHGRTTAVDHHANLQVLQRIRKFMLPANFEISQSLLAQLTAGYDIGDPVVDRLLGGGIKFAKPLTSLIVANQASQAANPSYQPSPTSPTNQPNESNKRAPANNAVNAHNARNADTANNDSGDQSLLGHSDFYPLYKQFATHPDWFDPTLAEIGAIAYRRYPLMLIWLLRNVALMAGYSIPALSLPLIKTGALVHDALPRLMRTYAYILAVSEHPALTGANSVLAIGGEGWRQSIHVRQIHGIVRQKLLKEGWDTGYWGVPINQTDMIATHLQFSLLIMRGLKLLGARISAEEASGILHLWHLASWWMGIDPERLPTTETQCWAWLYTYLATQYLDFEVGRPLAKALHDLPSQIMGEDNRKGRFVEQVNASVTRVLVGEDIGDGLGLPKSTLRHAVMVSVPILFTLDSARRHQPTIATKLERFRQKRQDNMTWWLKEHDPYYQP